jgi:hypothetical protein
MNGNAEQGLEKMHDATCEMSKLWACVEVQQPVSRSMSYVPSDLVCRSHCEGEESMTECNIGLIVLGVCIVIAAAIVVGPETVTPAIANVINAFAPMMMWAIVALVVCVAIASIAPILMVLKM